MNNERKFQKKVIKLIQAIRKCAIEDLELFMALIIVRFDNLDGTLDSEDSHFQHTISLYNELYNDNNVRNLLK